MCGFTGIVTLKQFYNRDKIESAKIFLLKRGPDYQGDFEHDFDDKKIYFFHSRLSIIDLNSTSNQPFVKKNYVIIFNGEIYNYKSIKNQLEKQGIKFNTNSDTEVLLESYILWGEECLNHFIGMFSFVILNLNDKTLFIARDRAGIKPLYISIENNEIVFSSDLYSLITLKKNKPSLNNETIYNYFSLGYSEGNNSFLNGILKVKPGSYINISLISFQYVEKIYWNPKSFFKINNSINEKNYINLIEECLVDAFKYRMVSDVPVGVFLSGGYDSSLLTAILSKEFGNELNTYTIGFEDQRYDESNHAEKVARHLGVKFNKMICSSNDVTSLINELSDAYDEPFGDSSAIPTMLVSKFASNDVKVVLSADGGDEIFAGYEKYSRSINFYNFSKITPKFIKNSLLNIPDNILFKLLFRILGTNVSLDHIIKFKRLLSSNSLQELSHKFGENSNHQLINYASNSINKNFKHGLGDLNDLLYQDFTNYLESDILKKIDRATMYYSIEGREPMLDHRIFELMATVPEKLKIKNGNKKYLLKKICHKYIPASIMERPKMGFGIPIKDMINNDNKLSQLFFDTLSDKTFLNFELLNKNEFIKCVNDFKNNKTENFISLWYAFNFIKWQQKINKF